MNRFGASVILLAFITGVVVADDVKLAWARPVPGG